MKVIRAYAFFIMLFNFAGYAAQIAEETPHRQLLQAIESKDLAKVKTLIGKGVDVNQPDDFFGFTPLIHAAHKRDNQEMIQFLISVGSDVNYTTKDGFTALMSAAERGNTQAVVLFIKNGANVNYQAPNGFTSLMSAAINNKPEVVNLLLQAGADVNLKDENGLSALDYVTRQKNEEIIQLLRDTGAE